MSASPPRIAVVGRQNVGKSTLVNRLFGSREAIAHRDPGVTRDRIEVEASWRGRTFGLVDTAGWLHRARGVEALAADQASRAIDDADVVLLVTDVRSGVTEDDAALARRLRAVRPTVLLVVNKVDADADEPDVASFHSLGLGEPVPVSALHGRGIGDLLDRIVELLPEGPGAATEDEDQPRFAIVGRPNVGKSSLFNRLVGEDRAVVYEDAGTTRDSVDALVPWGDVGTIRFVDTAGMRRAIRVKGIEYYSFLRAARAIERSDAAAVVLDSAEGLTAEDRTIASRVLEAGRALLIVANKWDLVEDKDRAFVRLAEEARILARASVIRTSAVRGTGVRRLADELVELRGRWASRHATSRVNEVLQAAVAARPVPRGSGALRYATQVAARPPTFVIFGGSRPPDPAYRRYLENRFRETFDLEGVPIRMRFRPREPRRR